MGSSTNRDLRTVSEIGEAGLLELVAAAWGPPPEGELWAGDDAAIVTHIEPRSLLTTDLMVEGIDFELAYASGADVGWKVMAVNVSDIAAMGGLAEAALVTLAVRPDHPVRLVTDLLDGLSAAAATWGVSIVGGDLSAADELMISVALTGSVEGDPVLRSGARPGDAICVTGSLGGSAGGLFLLRRGGDPASPASDRLISRHLRPRARAAEGVALKSAGASAMIDVSDGLALDLQRLMAASETGCSVEPDAVPVDPDLSLLADIEGAPVALEAALSGGEDYELLFTIPPEDVDSCKSLLWLTGGTMTQIGIVTDEDLLLGGEPLSARKELGWDHLQSP